MTTKKDDWVRICFNAWTRPKTPVMACLSFMRYRVEAVLKNGKVRVRTFGGHPLLLRSWVRVSP